MGHIRLGRLPKTRPWNAVIGALGKEMLDPIELAQVTAVAAQHELLSLQEDPSINYCFWFLARLVSSSRSEDFAGELSKLGISVPNSISGLSFVQQASRALDKGLRQRGQRSVFVQIAELSLREILSSNIIEQSKTLFGTTLSDIQIACRSMSTTKRFGEISKDFFARFTSRLMFFVIDKELSNYVGSNRFISSPYHVAPFQQALDQHCRESAKIVEEFAAGWFSKHNWESNNNISESEAAAFTSYALKKIQMELQAELREGRR